MKSSSFSYTLREYRNLLLENRVTVIDARLVEIDREEKRIILNDESVLRYDILLLAMGLQDIALKQLGYVSRGIAPVPEDKKHIDGVISIDDPYLYQHFREQGSIMSVLTHRKQPGTTIVYGYTLHCYCFIQGLINKGIDPSRIHLLIPDPVFEYDEGVDPLFGGDEHILLNNPAFQDDQNVLEFVHNELIKQGVVIFHNSVIKSLELDDK
mmetsp:Transcript_1983/g.241  ORF Transcript_1983/g.241 Transcript_1983/m.241 type:complete len:211 (+) Transcript_1983:3196-3828(+)